MSILDPLHGDPYQFWSGLGGGSPLFLGLLLFWRRHVCHVHSCWRLARHPVHGTGYVTCRRHHPTASRPQKVRAHDIANAHKAVRTKEPW